MNEKDIFEIKENTMPLLDFLSFKNNPEAFIMVDNTIKIKNQNNKLEILSLDQAIKKYKDIDSYVPNLSEETKGYFIRILPNTYIKEPIRVCFYMNDVEYQNIYNIFVVEQNSNVKLLSACLSSKGKTHLGINNYFVKENASLSLTQIHNWSKNISSSSKNTVILERKATFISNYISYNLGKKEKMSSMINIKESGSARVNSIIYSKRNSTLDLEDNIILNEKNARAEISSKTVSSDGKCIIRGCISGCESGTKGHIECNGLLIGKKGKIYTIPELKAEHPDTILSHEAAIGKISEEEIIYLMSKGLNEESAKSLIIQGFLENKKETLPKEVQEIIEKIIKNNFI